MWDQLQAAVERLGALFGDAPEGAVVLGSGLAGLLDALEEAASFSYEALGLPSPGVEGHAGVASLGRLNQRRVILMGGRCHVYEGHPMERVVFNVRALRMWGVKRLVLTSATGSLDPEIGPGSLVRVVDHINFMGRNPLIGPNLDQLGPRFPDMGRAYDPALGALLDAVAAQEGIPLRRGIYAAMLGPSYETPAEIRMLRTLGASVVGMSTVPEVIAAHHCGMQVAVVSVISNYAAGLKDEVLTHEDVKRVVAEAGPPLARLVTGLVGRW